MFYINPHINMKKVLFYKHFILEKNQIDRFEIINNLLTKPDIVNKCC